MEQQHFHVIQEEEEEVVEQKQMKKYDVYAVRDSYEKNENFCHDFCFEFDFDFCHDGDGDDVCVDQESRTLIYYCFCWNYDSFYPFSVYFHVP